MEKSGIFEQTEKVGKSHKILENFGNSDKYRVPTRTGKLGKMRRHFPVREKSGNFEQIGKVRENHTKYWKTEIN